MPKEKLKFEIKSWMGSILFTAERDNVKEALQDAVLQDAVLQDADLQGADLRGAVLRGADLRDADLRDADLQGAVLQDADLRGAVLRGADLRGAVLRGADLQDAVLQGADLRDAVLQGADLQGADLQGVSFVNLPQSFINECSQQMLYIFSYTKSELPYLREKLIAGEVDGSKYEGDCCCLVGSLAKSKKVDVDKYCGVIPFYEKSPQNPAETWFLNITQGDTPENNEFAAHALKLIDMVLTK